MILENDFYVTLLDLATKKVTLAEKTEAFMTAARRVAEEQRSKNIEETPKKDKANGPRPSVEPCAP